MNFAFLWRKPMKVVIDRTKWRRGGDRHELVKEGGKTQLLNDKGMMCCLGFVSKACGHTDKDILYVGGPGGIREKSENLISYLLRYRSGYPKQPYNLVENKLTDQAIAINDKFDLPQKEREDRLSQLFAKHRIQLEFVN